jgi:aspartate/glutamate racemase/GNAT superfamily N-acetyltransferase
MGPRSTAPFIDMIITECQQQYGARHDIDFPRMMICSQPAPFFEDRPTDPVALESAIRDGLQYLERCEVDFVAIACNTAHVYYRTLARSVGVPVLDMVELTVAALPQSAGKVALVAARPTVESGIYQTAMGSRGIECVAFDAPMEVDELLLAIRTSADPALLVALWRKITDRAVSAGASTMLVACLDLSGVLAHAATSLTVIDAARCLAKEVVHQWLVRRATTSARGEHLEVERGDFRISTDPARLDVAAVHAYLARSYWAEAIPPATVARSIQGSLCFGLFDAARRQVGFARVVTDRATFAYLCDVYILEEVRGQGLGKWLMDVVMHHPALTGLRRFALATRDAHELYSQFGFSPLKAPQRFMEIARPDIYREAAHDGR